MDLFQKNLFLAFRGFESLRRMDGSVLEGTICKQFVMSVKNRKNLKPCRGFKSFRSLVFRIQFMKKCVFGSSNPSTRRKIENGSMEIRKKLGAKKAEKSLEISAFLVFSRSDLNRPKDFSGALRLSPRAKASTPLENSSLSDCFRRPYGLRSCFRVFSYSLPKQKKHPIGCFSVAHSYKIDPYHKFFRNRSMFQSQRID